MSKISDRELLELENDVLEIPIQKFKKKNKINKKEKIRCFRLENYKSVCLKERGEENDLRRISTEYKRHLYKC